MTTCSIRALALAGFILLALPACANSSALPGAESHDADSLGAASPGSNSLGAAASPLTGVDLGPSSRVPHTRLALAGIGHQTHHSVSDTAGVPVQRVHEGHSDAHAIGTVNTVDPGAHKINLSHEPIPAIGWPAMTMDFPVSPSVDLSRIKPGNHVTFSIEKDKSGMYEIQSVQPAGGGR
jgi:Cu(I)/Ag(I) efflux system periplasmic protein CusF